ncbi:pre-mRNA processing RNA-helicase [Gnomoniopsis smithogilvyi]|uniref:RNA helicase n=1 Tax=Gnomoniopsis smithogilvyi TaxID=1191159 RepID=A0A9W8YZD5_9PEZI|nr:pre-mRNA processing RNA-helicase [Gnomoniopsis smithogilvyi]
MEATSLRPRVGPWPDPCTVELPSLRRCSDQVERSRGSRHDDRRDRDRDRDRGGRRDAPRDRRRSRSPGRYRDYDRDRERDSYRRRDRSLDRRGRDDDYRSSRRDGGSYRDRRRSRDRSPPRPRERSRDARPRRDSSQPRSRREGTTDSIASRNRTEDARQRGPAPANNAAPKEAEAAKSTTQNQAQSDKQAERLAKLEAWKKKTLTSKQATKDTDATSTRKLLAEMDGRATPSAVASPLHGSSAVVSPSTPQSAPDASPTVPYAGKFDPKAIAKKATARHHSPAALGVIPGAPTVSEKPIKSKISATTAKASVLPSSISGFGFQKAGVDGDKPAKRKLVLDDEETSKRKLAKLPDMSLEEADAAPFTNEDDESDSDGDNFAGTEEEAAAAARAAHERREERILQQSAAMQVDEKEEEKPSVPEPNVEASEPEPTVAPVATESDAMDVDDDVDPLDAFMGGLEEAPALNGSGSRKKTSTKAQDQEPEVYFSDGEYDYMNKGEENPGSILAIAAKKKKKDIPTIDYSKIDLQPIRKNFWFEPYELSQMTEAEVQELRLDLDGIKVSGKDVPKPVQKWSHCGLTKPMLDVVEELGYEKPTPIQMQALPVIMSGRDVVGVAKTGSGKTMAFLLPMFRHIKDQDPVKDDGPIGLILTPTRELATQIYRDCKPFLSALNLRAVCAYGGPPIKDQIALLKAGADIVVATTGRFIDLLAANQGRVVNLKRTTYIVLDEADRMFDMGFEPQVMKIFANVRPDRQTVLFSATMPRIIDSLVKKVLKNPVEITVGGKSVVAPEITQIVEIREEKDKFLRLLELLGDLYADDDDVRTLIFVERQEKADDLLRELLRKGYGCMSIHGGKDQVDRDSTIADFKSGVCPVMIATSVAARGLDVKQLKLVVNYDAPNHLEDYVHRAGRTGRAGNTGTAVTFVTEEQESCSVGIAKALEQSGQPVPERLDQMRKSWKEKVKAGKAKDQSGFGGKGLDRLDKEREAARMRERKTHKAEGEEDDEKEEATPADDAKKDKAATAVKSAVSAIVSRDAAKAAEESKVDTAEAVKPGAVKGGALDKAAQAVNDINNRLARAGQLRPGQPIDNKGPDAGAFHATLEINDFPQKARWAVTNRTNVAKILEATGTSITTKGNFYPTGKEPKQGEEPKLYILIEGDTEVVVSNALTELTRLLKDATIAAAETESRAPASGRYTIT